MAELGLAVEFSTGCSEFPTVLGFSIDFLCELWYNGKLGCFFLDIRPPRRSV